MKTTNKSVGNSGNSPVTPSVQNPSWYQRWHDTSHHFHIHWGIFLIIIAVVWAMLYTRIGDWAMSLNDPGITLKLAKASTELSLDPQTQSVVVGEDLVVNIVINTGNEPVDGVDIYGLHYDPTLLRVVDDAPGTSGTQITAGTLMKLNAANTVDTKLGNIKFAQVSEGGTSFRGKGVLATVHFKALAAGTAYLKFDFSKGSTVDSNAAYRGKDRLAKVVDGIYTIYASN